VRANSARGHNPNIAKHRGEDPDREQYHYKGADRGAQAADPGLSEDSLTISRKATFGRPV
jgi:hypothetical protein